MLLSSFTDNQFINIGNWLLEDESVFDISKYNSVNGALVVYSSLILAINAIPTTHKKAGMRIRFILKTNMGNENNSVYIEEYIECSYLEKIITNEAFYNIENWRTIDKHPSGRYKNLIESAGVFNYVNSLVGGKCLDVNLENANTWYGPFFVRMNDGDIIDVIDNNTNCIICGTNSLNHEIADRVWQITSSNKHQKLEIESETSVVFIRPSSANANVSITKINANSVSKRLDSLEKPISLPLLSYVRLNRIDNEHVGEQISFSQSQISSVAKYKITEILNKIYVKLSADLNWERLIITDANGYVLLIKGLSKNIENIIDSLYLYPSAAYVYIQSSAFDDNNELWADLYNEDNKIDVDKTSNIFDINTLTKGLSNDYTNSTLSELGIFKNNINCAVSSPISIDSNSYYYLSGIVLSSSDEEFKTRCIIEYLDNAVNIVYLDSSNIEDFGDYYRYTLTTGTNWIIISTSKYYQNIVLSTNIDESQTKYIETVNVSNIKEVAEYTLLDFSAIKRHFDGNIDKEKKAEQIIVNKNATGKTKILLYNLMRTGYSDKMLFGHGFAYDLGYNADGSWDAVDLLNSINSDGTPKPLSDVILKNDVPDETGFIESIYGVDLRYCCGTYYQTYENIDKAKWRASTINNIKTYYKRYRGAIVATSMIIAKTAHQYVSDPFLIKDPSACYNIINNIDGYQEWYYGQVQELCDMFNACIDEDNNPIPIIYRPLHEKNATGFWWNSGDISYIIQLYKDTVDYMKEKCNNLLFVYNFGNPPSYGLNLYNTLQAYYCGDDYCDILSADFYGDTIKSYKNSNALIGFNNFCINHKKVFILQEIGPNVATNLYDLLNPDSIWGDDRLHWFTKVNYPFVTELHLSCCAFMWWMNKNGLFTSTPYDYIVDPNSEYQDPEDGHELFEDFESLLSYDFIYKGDDVDLKLFS